VENKDKLVVGLTGSFGSGCSTLRESLRKLGFEPFSLSEHIRDIWQSRNPNKKREEATKRELQDIGNELREKEGDDYFADIAVKAANKKAVNKDQLVFDNIRNLKEVEYFRKEFPNFLLIAVDCSSPIRWNRVKNDYQMLGQTENQFEIDDRRDKYEEWNPHGQQVELCVDDADVMIDNDTTFQSHNLAIDKLKAKIEPYIDLLKGKLRPPTPFESYMSIAYSASLMSQCIKRRVGAVIVDERKDAIIAVGYNENPPPIKPCIVEYYKCYRDIYKDKYFEDLERKGTTCPKCGEKIKDAKYPFLCKTKDCNFDLDKHFIKDKAMNRCTALHAEEKAILSAGSRNVENYTIYTTTFPCFTCAQKIVYSKIQSVVYVEPYPDQDSIRILDEAKVKVRKFEGVKAKAYFRLFGPWRREMEMSVKAN
jgi:deoxycytidylate deaminase